ncbi:hypothetical protein G5C66_23075 [Nocardioides sp. KC13]|uniref:DUF559 domain-containing protein n=1 Tax=Nocardioides turkmenicus TaxID=2711220 RepID=A0A6M1R644_9ACTN|nr:hypothetical protein [Nocardioides sp. KC13]NGN95606.1 hypothetical protein [Nocardioides sp. KC13]
MPAHVPLSPLQRVLEASAVVPADGAVTGWAALAWQQVPWVDGCDMDGNELPVTILTPGSQARAQAGIEVSKERLLPRARQVVDGVTITDPYRSTAFEVRRAATPLAAVRWLDLVAASDLISLAEMTAFAETLGGWTGIDHLRRAIALADENVWSPPETDLRLTLSMRMGIAGVVCNRPVFDLDGRHVGTPDVLDLERGVVAEYDGALHLAGEQRAKDLRREGAFRRVGLEYVTMVAADRRDPADFVRRAREARARAARTAVADRRWTIDPPGWWTPTHTVEMRRALADWQRDRYLRAHAG